MIGSYAISIHINYKFIQNKLLGICELLSKLTEQRKSQCAEYNMLLQKKKKGTMENVSNSKKLAIKQAFFINDLFSSSVKAAKQKKKWLK